MEIIIKGNFVDIPMRQIYPAEIQINDGRISSVTPCGKLENAGYIIPGFIDSHVHIESSMLIPSEFARLAVVHGTVGTVSDPHEIANVCGIVGVEFMISNGNTVPLKFNFGAPSCVPATTFESAGATLNAAAVENLLQRHEIKYLSEMMNFPGVLSGDDEVLKKIKASKEAGKPVDGHAPGLRGKNIRQYIEAGISTDHECFTEEEAREKLELGMKILIREGSAARNFDALIDLLKEYPDMIMFCSDDKHPDSLIEGHINTLCQRAVAKGIDIYSVLKAACINPVLHYSLDIGLLREGDPADFLIVEDLVNFNVIKTFIDGIEVSSNGKTLIDKSPLTEFVNNFNCDPISPNQLYFFASEMPRDDEGRLLAIEAIDGQLITNKIPVDLAVINNRISADIDRDILLMAVVNRYNNRPIAKALIKNFGLHSGAIASSVAHDSHNIVAVGVDEESLLSAINEIIKHRGGISYVNNKMIEILPLPVAGLMTAEDGYNTAESYSRMDAKAKLMGSSLLSPFMTLSFMALLVIPHIKLSDMGLFDGDNFSLYSL